MNSVKAIRLRCLDCEETASLVRNCQDQRCSLLPYRMGKNPFRGKDKPSGYKPPLKAIRLYCLDCCLDQPNEVRLCPAEECALHPFRFGKNPFISEAKRIAGQKSASNLKKAPSTDDSETNSIETSLGKEVSL